MHTKREHKYFMNHFIISKIQVELHDVHVSEGTHHLGMGIMQVHAGTLWSAYLIYDMAL